MQATQRYGIIAFFSAINLRLYIIDSGNTDWLPVSFMCFVIGLVCMMIPSGKDRE